jgi:hypothetical protein
MPGKLGCQRTDRALAPRVAEPVAGSHEQPVDERRRFLRIRGCSERDLERARQIRRGTGMIDHA